MKSIIKITSVLIASVLLTSCTSNKQTHLTPENKQVELKKSPYKEGAYYYLNEKVDLKNYINVTIPFIPIIKEKSDESIDESTMNSISTYFKNNLQSELNSVLLKNNGAKNLTINISITSIEKEYKSLKFYQYIPVGLAITALKRGVGGEDKNLITKISLKVSDSNTKELIAVVVDSESIKGFEKDETITFKDVKPSLDNWIKHYKNSLEKLVDGNMNK